MSAHLSCRHFCAFYFSNLPLWLSFFFFFNDSAPTEFSPLPLHAAFPISSIPAENRGMTEGCELMLRLARAAGFDNVTRVPPDGQPGVKRGEHAGLAVGGHARDVVEAR